jgi:hypothetical protein
MFATSAGIFAVDSDGLIQLVHGSPIAVDASAIFEGNDDGANNSCVETAFRYLGLDPEPIRQYRQTTLDPASCPIPYDLLDRLLSQFELVKFDGTAAEFIQQHRTGSFYVSVFNDDFSHVFALVDGTANNLTFNALNRKVRAVRKIK